jgi:hypothetical protein
VDADVDTNRREGAVLGLVGGGSVTCAPQVCASDEARPQAMRAVPRRVEARTSHCGLDEIVHGLWVQAAR